jgi:signal transduction histidine kinase
MQPKQCESVCLMRIVFLGFILVIWSVTVSFAKTPKRDLFFKNLLKLEFAEAKKIAAAETDSALRFEMFQLADILYYEGQIERSKFTTSGDGVSVSGSNALSIVRELNAGYISLFYDQTKGNAFKHFYDAYQGAKEEGSSCLVKASLVALLKYFNFEIAQNSDSYLPYLNHFESIQSDSVDRTWATLYKMIFYSKSLNKIDSYYFTLAEELDHHESRTPTDSPILVYIFFEKALRIEIQDKFEDAAVYYKKTIDAAGTQPFLKNHKFFALLKLMSIEVGRKNFEAARGYLKIARTQINTSDTLRSNYYLNLQGAFLLNAQNRNDSAFALLKKAYGQDFRLDFRRNTLAINRLNVELDTQEKENANLRLKQNTIWLMSAVGGLVLLTITIYFAYTNQRSKVRIEQKEREVQAMKLEKVLKDQELFGIDSMIQGQEKERQRIANDLHDNLGSLLATLKLHFQNLRMRKDRGETEQGMLFQTTDALIEEAYQQVRTIAHAANAGVSGKEGLLPAVKHFASKVSVMNRLTIEVEDHGMDQPLDNSMEITIFRIVQELITNAIKHAQASEVTIHLTRYEDSINVMVEDNGVGFDISRIKPGETMGLYSIQKRIEILGGTVTIDSIIQNGTTIIIDIPIS